MKYFFVVFYIFFLIYPAEAVTTKMFKVLDTCARYRLGEIDAYEAIKKLKLASSSSNSAKDLVRKYCYIKKFSSVERKRFNSNMWCGGLWNVT